MIRRREDGFAIESGGELVALGFESKGVPLTGGDLCGSTFDLTAHALDHVIEVDIIFERIRTQDIVVVRIDKTQDDPPRAIDAAGDRLESDCHFDIGPREGLVNGQGKAVVGLVIAGLRDDAPTWNGRIPALATWTAHLGRFAPW